jgi:hypothetical protein
MTTSNHYIVGTDAPTVVITHVPADKFWYERKEHARKGNYDIEQLADDPDFDIRVDLDWSDIHE